MMVAGMAKGVELKILVIGSSGLLGSKILDFFSKKYKTSGTYFRSASKAKTYKNVFHLDVRRHKVVERVILDFNPDVIIYAASITQPDVAENDPESAFAVNCEGLKNVASICASLKKKIVYISSDYVFSGEKGSPYFEDDEVDPINVLGESKAKAEQFLLDQVEDFLIIRSSMVFGYSPYLEGRGIFNTVLESLSKGEELKLDNSMPRYPVLADDISKAIESLIARDETGVFHVSHDSALTKFEFGKMIAMHFGLPLDLLAPINESRMKLLSPRPFEVQLCSKKARSLGVSMTSPVEAVSIHQKQRGCLFRMVYSVRPDMLVLGQNASEFRIGAGERLAQDSPIPKDIDCIVPIPESGIYSATGFAAGCGKPLFFGIIRDYFTEKTLYSSTVEERNRALKKKLIVVESIVRGKNIVIVDEAIISGSTIGFVVNELRRCGAGNIHVRIPSPVMSHFCDGRVLPQKNLLYKELAKGKHISKKEFEKALAEKFNVESFSFLSLDSFLDVGHREEQFCHSCFLDSRLQED